MADVATVLADSLMVGVAGWGDPGGKPGERRVDGGDRIPGQGRGGEIGKGLG